MPAINIGTMVGSGSVRVALNGFSGDMPEKALSRAEAAIASALDGGAFGLSMGLMYAPEMYYGAPALKRLVRAMGGRGVFAVHVRGEGKSLVASVREALALAKDAGVRAVISHFKTAGCPPMGEAYLSAKGLIDAARCAGQDVSADVYPYAAGSTSITTLLPPSMLSGGIDALTKRLSQESERAALRQALDNPSGEYDNLLPEIGFKSIRIASGALAGKTVEAASRERGVHGADIIADLITTERGETTIVNFIVAEENLHDALSIPHAAIVSDALYGAQMPHPRVYGAFPRMLRLAREQKRPLPGIIARMTRIPAERYGIRERGRLKPGYFADIAVFDPETVTDLATYESPRQLSIGIRHVLVNGQHTLVDGKYTGATRGRVLRRDQ